MRKVVCDIETDGLLLEATKIHCIVCMDLDSGETYKFSNSKLTDLSLNDFVEFSKTVDTWIGHNWLGFDIFILNKFLLTDSTTKIHVKKVEDTLVMSRLFMQGKVKKHSIEAWANRLNIGVEKIENDDWQRLTPNMIDRCVNDVKLNAAVYRRLLKEGKGYSKDCVRIEHCMQYLLTKQKMRGAFIDVEQAERLYIDCYQQSGCIREKVQNEYPPVRKNTRTFRPRVVVDKKTGEKRLHGQDKRTLDNSLHEKNKDGTYTLYVMQDFNLDSPSQCVERLEKAGWKPVDFNKPTKKMVESGVTVGSPKINETNLATIPDTAPQGAKLISEYKMIVNRARTVKQWLDNVDENGRLHGDVISVGAWTQRCAHARPQTANIPGVRKASDGTILKGKEGGFGFECRSCWTVDDKDTRRIVGVDAKSIQLRVLAHYMDDPSYTDIILNDDPHTAHRDMLGLPPTDTGRDMAKRWMYAWLLGAGYGKLGRLMDGTPADAKESEKQFLERLPALAALKRRQRKEVNKGYFIGLDGRKVPALSDHLVMSGYLQAGEAVIMKKAYIDSSVAMKEMDADIVLFVHDEFQADSHLTCAEECGTIMVKAINNTTDFFKLKCPMEGDIPKIGTSWAYTH